MTTFHVTIIVETEEVYLVDADSADEALKALADGIGDHERLSESFIDYEVSHAEPA